METLRYTCVVIVVVIRNVVVVVGKKCLRPFFHEIHMRTKFHFHALYGVQA